MSSSLFFKKMDILNEKIIIYTCMGCLNLVSIEVCTNRTRDTLTNREVTVSIVVHGLINKYNCDV